MTTGEAKHLHEFLIARDLSSYMSLKTATAWGFCIKSRTNKMSFGHLRNLSLRSVRPNRECNYQQPMQHMYDAELLSAHYSMYHQTASDSQPLVIKANNKSHTR
jgi:hypothetical protein